MTLEIDGGHWGQSGTLIISNTYVTDQTQLLTGVVIQIKTTLLKYLFRKFPGFRPINLLKRDSIWNIFYFQNSYCSNHLSMIASKEQIIVKLISYPFFLL